MSEGRSAYEVLGVADDASAEAIKAAFHALCLRLHPDKRSGDESGVGELAAVRQAYDVLRDGEKRAEYDAARATEVFEPVITDELSAAEVLQLPTSDGLFQHDCRCGGAFLIAKDTRTPALVGCDTCSLYLQIAR